MRLTVLVVDDEPLARTGLRLLLEQDAEVATILEAASGREAVELIRGARPDLVLLDVQMPEMDGFAVIEHVGEADMPGVVFVTAHDRYAIRAFETNAIDYLLKPVTASRFTAAMARAKARRPSGPDAAAQMRALLEAMASPQRFVARLAVRTAGRIAFVNVADVAWMRAAENYVELHVATGAAGGAATHLLHVSMNALEQSLDPSAFIRIHRSVIVNIREIKDVEPAQHGEYVVRLQSGQRLQSGRTYHARIKSLIANPF
jgi:two-component system LytT family response regulator